MEIDYIPQLCGLVYRQTSENDLLDPEGKRKKYWQLKYIKFKQH